MVPTKHQTRSREVRVLTWASSHTRSLWLGLALLAFASSSFAAPIAPDDLFFAPSSLATSVYPSVPITGDGANTPWQSVWTTADVLALDPGRFDITITGADILPVLVSNPGSSDGSYTAADLAAINVGNYTTFYKQKPGTDITNPAADYVADLTANVLTVQFKAAALYAVRLETTSSATAGGTLESRSYLFREFVNGGFLEDGAPDAAGAQREVDVGDADIYVVSDPTPADPTLDAAAANLTAKGKTVVRAKDVASACKAICDAAKAKGGKVKANMVGHGRPGSIKMGSERINDDADGVMTPAAFQKCIEDCANGIGFTSCNTAQGKKGDKFLHDFANSLGIASGWTVPITVEGAVKDKDGKVTKDGYFDVEATGKTVSDEGVKATEPILSSPSTFRPAFFDVFYFGAEDGFLYAQTTTGGIVAGFPVDMRSLHLPGAITPTGIRSRPAIYFGAGTSANIFFTTVQGHVVSLAMDGTPHWAVWPDPTASNCSSTPAVTADGSLFVALNGSNGPRVWKLNAATGGILGQTPPLALPTSDSSSLAVAGGLIYLGVTQPIPGQGSLIVLDTNLVIRATGIAQGEGVAAPPFVNGPFMYDGTLAGNLYKVNSVTTNPDPTFGVGGKAPISEPMASSLFAVQRTAGVIDLFAGTTHGRIFQVSQAGTFVPVFDSIVYGEPAPIEGLVMVRSGTDYVMAFGAGHTFFEAPLSNPAGTVHSPDRGTPDAGFSTAPVYAASARTFAIGNRDGYLYTFPFAFP